MATFRKRGPYQWQAQVRKKGQPLQTKTFETRALAEQWARAIEVEMDKGVFISRAEAESTTLKELFERYLAEITPRKKGASSETNRLRALMRLPLARRYVAGIRGMDIARFRDERLRKITPSTLVRRAGAARPAPQPAWPGLPRPHHRGRQARLHPRRAPRRH